MWDLRRMPGIPQIGIFFHTRHPESSTKNRSSDKKSPPKVTAGMFRCITNICYERNIAIARLYLDNIFKEQSLNVVDKVNDRLPRNITALFDAGIERIKQRPKHEADIALLAIAAVGEQDRGIPLVSLANWMGDALTRLPHLTQAPPRSLEDILRYANGFIHEQESDDRCISAYSFHFARYVKENYNDSLFWARNQLNIHRTFKTLTMIASIPPKLTSPPLVSSPPSTDGEFQNADESTVRTWLQGPQKDYFNRSSRPGVFPLLPKALPRHSYPILPTKAELELNKKKLGRSSRSNTMLPAQKTDFTTNVASIQEEPRQFDHENRSIHRYDPLIRTVNLANIHTQYVTPHELPLFLTRHQTFSVLFHGYPPD